MDVLSYPFRLAPGGGVATVPDGSSEAHAEAIAVLALTRRGERVLVPGFGITDPVFTGVDVAELNAALATFGPVGVRVTEVDAQPTSETTSRALLTYTEA